MLLRSANIASLDYRRDAHLLNHIHKKKNCIELQNIKQKHTRARASPLFKTIVSKCKQN